MKLLFFSDVHGSPESLSLLEKHIEFFKPERLILLGDALYHGPRNSLPSHYSTSETAAWLNQRKNEILAVRGNCDTEVDQMVLQYPLMSEYAFLMADGKHFFLTHGHHWNPGDLPPLNRDSVFCYGHTHIPDLRRNEDGIILFNPGSITIPKGGFPASFGFFDGQKIVICNLNDRSELFSLEV